MHYTLSTKQKKKKRAQTFSPERPPPEPKCPPPPSKPPLPDPKPPDLKNKNKLAPKRFVRRRKDVYVADSDSDTDSQSKTEERPPILLPSQQGVGKVPYNNIMVAPPIDDLFRIEDDEHMYDSAEIVPPKKSGTKVNMREVVKIGSPPARIPEAAHAVGSPEAVTSKQYQNVALESNEPSYDENPNLPPRPDRTPIDISPALPPRPEHTVKDTFPNHAHKKLPAPPIKIKCGPVAFPKSPSAGPATNANGYPGSPKTRTGRPVPPSKPGKLDQMLELNSILSHRNTARILSGETLSSSPPVVHRKPQWKAKRPFE